MTRRQHQQRPYVNNGGTIERGDSKNNKKGRLLMPYFSIRRLLWAFGIFVVLYVTNPANDAKRFLPATDRMSGLNLLSTKRDPSDESAAPNSFSSRYFSYNDDTTEGQKKKGRTINLWGREFTLPTSWMSSSSGFGRSNKRGVTNFVLYSLKKEGRGIYMDILAIHFRLCRFEGPEGGLCEWIADNLCHEMRVFDPKNHPFTAHRLITGSLLFFTVLSACAANSNRYVRHIVPSRVGDLTTNPFGLIFSVLIGPSSLWNDLMGVNILLYPTLTVMDRVVSFSSSNSTEATWNFYVSAFALVVLIGGMANLIASTVMKEVVYGTKGALAAGLGYLFAVSPSKTILTLLGMQLSPGGILASVTVCAAASSVFFDGNIPGFQGWTLGYVLAWVLGGVAGSALGKFQVDRYGVWWIPF